LKRTTGEIEGISFKMGNICFKGSEVDRKFSYNKKKKEFQNNIGKEEVRQKETREKQVKQAEQTQQKTTNQPEKEDTLRIGGVKLTPEQMKILKDGGYVYLENMKKKDGTIISSYAFFDDKMENCFYPIRILNLWLNMANMKCD
jgi:hypothetical protein